MDKLIKTIQDEINNLMKSKIAQTSDKRLDFYNKRVVGSRELIQKISDEYNQSTKTLEKICVENGIAMSTFRKQCEWYGIERPTKEQKIGKKVVGVQRCYQVEEKIKDIQSGMVWKEYQLKWGVSEAAYYKLKKKLKKNLVD
jgi:hypothetical protein